VTASLIGVGLLLAECGVALGADDGAALYKTKCGSCHGASGEGKPAMKAPALKGMALDADGMAQQITKSKGGLKAPHNKGIAGLNGEQAKAIAEYVKTLK
jgi:mono/diheme cytochrome c family protein